VKTAYLDCSTGISGDMCLGAIIDAGVPIKALSAGLRRLPVKGYRLETRKVKRASLAATKVDVILQRSSQPKKWKDIETIIRGSSLSDKIRERGLRIFQRLFEAEGKVHGEAYHEAHLHELGAVDCIVDIFGTLIGLEVLGIDRVYSSAVNLGSGVVMTEHGRLPVPAPATAEILKGVPVYSSGIPFELATPTGSAILREVAEDFTNMPLMKIKQTGYGAGKKDITGVSNTLRIIVGEQALQEGPGAVPGVTVLETAIDDMNPQLYEYVMERLFDAGALDVYLSQVIMKKGRPGIVMTILCNEDRRTDIERIIFTETTSIGVRYYVASRTVLERSSKEVGTKFGKIRFKVSQMPDGTVKRSPEYEDCKKAAKEYDVPLIRVMREMNRIKK
jgi:uncharacterized protein (TIGR00299 family) protein